MSESNLCHRRRLTVNLYSQLSRSNKKTFRKMTSRLPYSIPPGHLFSALTGIGDWSFLLFLVLISLAKESFAMLLSFRIYNRAKLIDSISQ